MHMYVLAAFSWLTFQQRVWLNKAHKTIALEVCFLLAALLKDVLARDILSTYCCQAKTSWPHGLCNRHRTAMQTVAWGKPKGR